MKFHAITFLMIILYIQAFCQDVSIKEMEFAKNPLNKNFDFFNKTELKKRNVQEIVILRNIFLDGKQYQFDTIYKRIIDNFNFIRYEYLLSTNGKGFTNINYYYTNSKLDSIKDCYLSENDYLKSSYIFTNNFIKVIVLTSYIKDEFTNIYEFTCDSLISKIIFEKKLKKKYEYNSNAKLIKKNEFKYNTEHVDSIITYYSYNNYGDLISKEIITTEQPYEFSDEAILSGTTEYKLEYYTLKRIVSKVPYYKGNRGFNSIKYKYSNNGILIEHYNSFNQCFQFYLRVKNKNSLIEQDRDKTRITTYMDDGELPIRIDEIINGAGNEIIQYQFIYK